MKGIEICEKFWNEYGRPVISERLPDMLPYIAAGLVGQGSECYGYDDEISRDHDFEQGFQIFIPGEDIVDRRQEFLLERAYESLPKEFMGLRRNPLNPCGGNRHGVHRIAEFYENATGLSVKPESWRDYLAVPEYALSEVRNGKIFYDGLGQMTEYRTAWQNIPKDVVLKKLAGYLILMSQAGEYNYSRSLERGDTGAAKLSAHEFVTAAMGAVMWAEGKPLPYYKWSFRAVRETAGAGKIPERLEEILNEKDAKGLIKSTISDIMELVECDAAIRDLQHTAQTLNNRIEDSELRNMSILAAV